MYIVNYFVRLFLYLSDKPLPSADFREHFAVGFMLQGNDIMVHVIYF